MTPTVCDDRCQGTKRAVRPRDLSELLALPEADLARCDIARMNLLCAEGLPGAEGLDIDRCLATLDQWTDSIRRYTADALPKFRRDPLGYGGDIHEGVFRFVAIVTLLKHPRGLGVAYQPTAKGNFIFLDSRDDLIHGLLTRRLGTCASLPALFVAIGRRLGYPMHMALAKRHFLCQWVDHDGSRRNLEGSGSVGGDSPPDEFYWHVEYPLTAADMATARYLRPMTVSETLASFLQIRGHCFTDNQRFDEGKRAYINANKIAPHWVLLDSSIHRLGECRPIILEKITQRDSGLPTVFTGDLFYPTAMDKRFYFITLK